MQGEKPRIEPRTRAMVRARLRDSHRDHDVCIIDISTRGLLATTANPPSRGDFVELTVGRNQLVGHITWAGEHRFGIGLQERVSVAALLEGGNRAVSLRANAANARAGSSDQYANSGLIAKAAQYAALIALAGGAAFAISQITSKSMEPVDDVAVAMHAEG